MLKTLKIAQKHTGITSFSSPHPFLVKEKLMVHKVDTFLKQVGNLSPCHSLAWKPYVF